MHSKSVYDLQAKKKAFRLGKETTTFFKSGTFGLFFGFGSNLELHSPRGSHTASECVYIFEGFAGHASQQ